MRAPGWIAATGDARWRRPALIAASLAVHALVLGLLGLRAIQLDLPAAERVILVEIEPRPLLPGETVRPPSPAPPVADAPRPAAAPATSAAPGAPRDEDEPPAPPAPRLAEPAAGATPPPADVGTAEWQVRPRSFGERVGQGLRLRLPGCANRALLSAAEQAVCDTRFGERAAAAPPIEGTGNAARDAAFAAEGARALANYERRRRPLAGGVGVVGPQDGPGSNFGTGVAGAHLDPSLRPDSTENIRTRRRDGPRD